MGGGRWRAAAATAAVLAGLAAPLCVTPAAPALGSGGAGATGEETAAPASTPLLGLGLSSSGVSVSVPVIGVGVTVSTPSVSVSPSEVSVSTPSVGVTTPGVTVTVPSVGVSSSPTPTVTVGETTVVGGGSSTPTEKSKPTEGQTDKEPSGTVKNTTNDETDGGKGAAASSPAHASTPRTSVAAAKSAVASGATSGGAANAGKGRTRQGRRDSPTPADTATTPTATAPSGAGTAPASASVGGATRRRAGASGDPLSTLGGKLPLPLPVPDWSKPIILALALLAIFFAVRSRFAARRARRLERQRAALLRDLDAMQAALVPEVPARLGALGVSVAYRPAEGPAAGGDFYDVFVPEDGSVAIILGDVAGHGHAALEQAALTRYTLRAYLQAGLEPRAALALAGQVLANPPVELFATVAVAVFDERAGTLTYALAGHPPPIVAGVDAHEHVLACSSPPLGWSVPTGRRQTTMSLPAGAVVCLFSDGLIEARVGEELLGRERLSELVAALGEGDAAALLARVRAASATPDDMAACVLRGTHAAPQRVHVEEIEVDGAGVHAPHLTELLEGYGLTALDAVRVRARAEEMTTTGANAVIRLDLSGPAARATVRPAASDGQAGASAHGAFAPAVSAGALSVS